MKFLLQGLNVFCWRTFSAKFINESHTGDRATCFPTPTLWPPGYSLLAVTPMETFPSLWWSILPFLRGSVIHILIPPQHLGVSSQTGALGWSPKHAMGSQKSHFHLGDLRLIFISAKLWLRNCSLPQTMSLISDPWLHLHLSDARGHLFIIHCTSAERLFPHPKARLKIRLMELTGRSHKAALKSMSCKLCWVNPAHLNSAKTQHCKVSLYKLMDFYSFNLRSVAERGSAARVASSNCFFFLHKERQIFSLFICAYM